MAEAILTLADALNRANSGQTIAPVSAKLRASMAHATMTLARNERSRPPSISFRPKVCGPLSSPNATLSSEPTPTSPPIEQS